MSKYREPIKLAVLSVVFGMTAMQAQANEALNTYLVANKSTLASVCVVENQSLLALAESCPIGNALWGNKTAKYPQGKSEFWIQCGAFGSDLSADKQHRIAAKVDAPINIKREAKLRRCLIGPYFSFTEAKQQLSALQSDPLFKQSVLREVAVQKTEKVTPPVAKVTPVVKSIKSVSKVVEPKKPKPAPVVKKPVTVKTSGTTSVTIRKHTVLQGREYVVPFTDNGNEGFYMEEGKPWLRATGSHAKEICQQLGMSLLSKEQWQQLVQSETMKKENWPLLLPYWGENTQGLFKDGAVRELKNTSMLNVMCTKKGRG